MRHHSHTAYIEANMPSTACRGTVTVMVAQTSITSLLQRSRLMRDNDELQFLSLLHRLSYCRAHIRSIIGYWTRRRCQHHNIITTSSCSCSWLACRLLVSLQLSLTFLFVTLPLQLQRTASCRRKHQQLQSSRTVVGGSTSPNAYLSKHQPLLFFHTGEVFSCVYLERMLLGHDISYIQPRTSISIARTDPTER